MKSILKFNLIFSFLILSYALSFAQNTCGEIVPFASEPVVNGCDVTYVMDLSIGINWILYPGNGLPQSSSVSSLSITGNVYTHTYMNATGVIYPNIRYFDANWNLICSSFYPITIDCPAPCGNPPNIVLSQDGPLTCNQTSVTINTNTSGYCYKWSNGETTSSITVTSPGLYCVTVSDCITGCEVEVCETVEQDILTPNLDCSILDPIDGSVLATDCTYEICDGECVILSVNGNEDYTYSWNPPAVDNGKWYTDEICEAGTYTLTITAANGCQQIKTFNIDVISPPAITLTSDGPLGCEQPTVTITATGGYCYDWSNGLGTEKSATVTTAGEYCVTVTDCTSDCETVECITIEEGPDFFDVTCYIMAPIEFANEVVGVIEESCEYTLCDGECIRLSVGDEPMNTGYTYNWQSDLYYQEYQDGWLKQDLCEAGTYSVTITNQNGCSIVKDFTITEQDAPPLEITASGEVDCTMEEAVVLSATLDPNYEYFWNQGLGTTAEVEIFETGQYCVTVTNTVSGCTASECIEMTGGSLCNVGDFNASAEVNGVMGGGPYLFADGLLEGEYLCWEFRPKDVPDSMIITIGGEVVLNTGNVAGLRSSKCSISPYNEFCDCISHFLGDGDDGQCIDLNVGMAFVTQVYSSFGDTYALSTISGSILITSDLACKEISVTIANDCGEEYDKDWDASLYCCDYPLPCFDGYFPPTTNGYCCTRPGVGTTLQWDAVTDAVGYIITINQEDSGCCPDVELGSTTPISIQVAQNFFILPDDLPECFSWYLQAVGPNGEISAPGSTSCFNNETECIEYNPNTSSTLCLDDSDFDVDPCPANPAAPGPIDCDLKAFGLQLDWPDQSWAIAYTIIVDFGPSDCCPESTESGTTIFQVTESEVLIPRVLGNCFTYTVFSICEDYTVSPPSDRKCVDNVLSCDGHKGERRSEIPNHELLISNANFKVYPNPANSRINVYLNTDQESQLDIQLRSVDGRLMKTMVSQIAKGENTIAMDTEDIPVGIYFLQIETEHHKMYKKVVIQK